MIEPIYAINKMLDKVREQTIPNGTIHCLGVGDRQQTLGRVAT